MCTVPGIFRVPSNRIEPLAQPLFVNDQERVSQVEREIWSLCNERLNIVAWKLKCILLLV